MEDQNWPEKLLASGVNSIFLLIQTTCSSFNLLRKERCDFDYSSTLKFPEIVMTDDY